MFKWLPSAMEETCNRDIWKHWTWVNTSVKMEKMGGQKRSIALFSINKKEEGDLEVKNDATIDNTEGNFIKTSLHFQIVHILYQKDLVSEKCFTFKYLEAVYFYRGWE